MTGHQWRQVSLSKEDQLNTLRSYQIFDLMIGELYANSSVRNSLTKSGMILGHETTHIYIYILIWRSQQSISIGLLNHLADSDYLISMYYILRYEKNSSAKWMRSDELCDYSYFNRKLSILWAIYPLSLSVGELINNMIFILSFLRKEWNIGPHSIVWSFPFTRLCSSQAV